ncbi:MAG: urea amidolyase associated protein UAAP1 [Actinomycetota bacterium]
MTTTGTTDGARAHARAQADTAVAEFWRNVPLDEPDVIWRETVEQGNYAVRVLPRGARLRLSDPGGDTCVQLLVFNHHQRAERLNVADTVKVQWQAYLSDGQMLLSDMGRVLMSIESDTSRGHDTFNAMSNRAWNAEKYGSHGLHDHAPNARDLLAVALSKAGLTRRDVAPAINLFKAVIVEPDGSFRWEGEQSPPGGEVVLRADMDVLVALAVTPHVLDPRAEYRASPLHIEAREGTSAPIDDRIRNSSPEARRAFENVDDWYRGRPMVGASS